MALGGMEVLVQGDPAMRRPYVVVEGNPEKFPSVNAAGARALSDWLTGGKGQAFLRAYGQKAPGGIPLYYPIQAADSDGK
jgi:tungstate transport system substrate-binding protein